MKNAALIALVAAAALVLASTNPVLAEGDDHDDHDHDHAHGHKCACEAKEFNFTISCDDLGTTEIESAIEFLKNPANDCKEKMKCEREYLILQAHHDHCPSDVLPKDAEKDFHDFQDSYSDCMIVRQYNAKLSDCAKVDCTDSAAFTKAAADLKDNDCMTSCDSDVCVSAIQTILMGHDTCGEGEVPIEVEKALHDYEEICEANLCNTSSGPVDIFQETCEEEGDHKEEGKKEEGKDDHDHEDDHDHDHDHEGEEKEASSDDG